MDEAAKAFVQASWAGHDPRKERPPPPVYELQLPPPEVARAAHHQFAQHHLASVKNLRNANNGANQFTSSMRPAIEHGKAPNLKDLKSICLEEVAQKMNYIHSKSVLFVKTIYEPVRMVALQTLVEDEFGDCVVCSIYNLGRTGMEDPNDLLPNGSYIAILAPYMKTGQDIRGGTPAIRCDNPQCIVVFDTKEAWEAARARKSVPSERQDPKKLRLDGNKAFQKGKFQHAIRFYSRALGVGSIENDDAIACWSNRAAAYLKAEQWEYAEQDARQALERSDGAHLKAKFRLASALMRQNQLEEALTIATSLQEENPKEQSFQALLADCTRCLREQSGEYDIVGMHREQSTPMQQRPFHADFTSDKIELGATIHPVPTFSYRGCRAKSALEEGELILASKALAFNESLLHSSHFNIDPYTNTYEKGDDNKLLFDVVSLIAHRPAMGSKIYQLDAGKGFEEPVKMEDMGLVDLPRIRRILASNRFGASNVAEEIEQMYQGLRQMSDEKDSECKGVGLWTNEALLNHSCVPNCTWCQIGDHMFVHANRKIECGEELCVAYTTPEDPFEGRTNKFRHWVSHDNGFVCQCPHCNLMRTKSNLRKMESQVLGIFSKVFKDSLGTRTPRALMINQLLPPPRRREILDAHAHLPLGLQHYTVYRVLYMEAITCAFDGRHQGAAMALEKAATVLKNICGSFDNLQYGVALWRVAMGNMACGNDEKTITALHELFESSFAMVPDQVVNTSFFPMVPSLTVDPSLPAKKGKLQKLALKIFHKRTMGRKVQASAI